MKKIPLFLSLLLLLTLCGCSEDGSTADKRSRMNVGDYLQSNQPTPDDISYSLQRYNLIRRAYWVNGMHEKARTLPCEVEKPLGYIYLFLEGVGCVSQNTVDGQVTSLQTYLTPDSEYYSSSGYSEWLPDVDGTYGENPDGIFFFTADGNYIEWKGPYLYSNVYVQVDDPVLKIESIE